MIKFLESKILFKLPTIDTRRDTVAKSVDVTSHQQGLDLLKKAEVAGCCTASVTKLKKIKKIVYLCSKGCHNPKYTAKIKAKVKKEKQENKNIAWDNFKEDQDEFFRKLREDSQLTGDQKSNWLDAFAKQGYNVIIEDSTKIGDPHLVRNDQGKIIAYIYVVAGVASISKTLRGNRKYISQIKDILK